MWEIELEEGVGIVWCCPLVFGRGGIWIHGCGRCWQL
jgi:hypothetical protein